MKCYFFHKALTTVGRKKKNLRGRKWVQNWQLLDFDMSSLLPDLATKSLKQTLTHDRSAEAVKWKTAGCTLVCYCLSCCCSWLKLLCLWAKSWSVTIHMKPANPYIPVVLFVIVCKGPRLYLLSLWVRWFKWQLPGSNFLWSCLLSSSKRLSLCGGISK